MKKKMMITGSSGNDLDSRSLFVKAAEQLGFDDPSAWILPDNERFADQPRNLAMDCSLIARHGIRFADSVEGIEQAVKYPFRTESLRPMHNR